MKKLLNAVLGFALILYVTTPVYAFTPLQSPILSTAAVTPNVMFLIDNSGSMESIIWHSGYDDSKTYRTADYCINDSSSCGNNNWRNIASETTYYTSNFKRAGCANGQYRFRFGGQQRCLLLHDPLGNNDTRYKGNYLNYVLGENIPNSAMVNDYRMNVAREVTKDIVADNRGLRYGLFSLGTGTNQSGGLLLRDVNSFSKSLLPSGAVDVSEVQANNNYNNFVSSVNGLRATTWTPISEAYYEISRYFRGMSRFQGGSGGAYTSPIQYRCQKNFGIVITDGLPTYDRTFPNDDPLRDNPLVTGSNNLPNWDGLNNDGNNLNGNGEGDTLYLDDIAQFVYDVDLRNTTANDRAGRSFNDPDFSKQNIITYTVGFAVNNEMLQDAAAKGRGVFYQANNADDLKRSLSLAINEISAKAGSGGAGASSSATLTTETYYYKTLYNPEDWRGTIEAYRLSSETGRPLNERPNWTTDNTITPTANGASYQTYVPAASGGSVVELSYANLSVQQQAILNASASANVTGTELIAWVKGSNAATALRQRKVLLGDIINSSLERMAPSDKLAAGLEGDPSYDEYLRSKRSSLTSSLLVNANDGLFHVINAANGSHRYGYMPSSLLPSLNVVANPAYAESGSHKFMVDGLIQVADAQIANQWATVAVSGMGAGGKSFFAVKLFAAGSNDINALWEISAPVVSDVNNQWNDLGYTYSKPVVGRDAAGKWVAVFGNGYASHQGKAALFIVDLATGELIRKVVVDENASGTVAERAYGNGLSSPAVVVNAQSQIQGIYAGDLKGNLWEFDLAGNSSKLFAAGPTRPITAAPLVSEHPEGGYLVSVGTGKLSEVNDKVGKDEQAFYAIWDKPNRTATVLLSSLLKQSIVEETQIRGQTYFKTSTLKPDWNVNNGWYLPLIYNNSKQGERVIYPAQTTLGRVIFVTAKVDAADPCASSGSGRLVELDMLTGSMLSEAVLDTNKDGYVNELDVQVSGVVISGGLPGLPVIIDKGANKPTQTKIILLSTGQAEYIDEKAKDSGISRRIMWRQLQ